MRGFPGPVFETWAELLTKHDQNGDRRVSRDEVNSRRNYYEGFSYADVDRDRFISEAEWNVMRNAGVGNFGLTALRRAERGMVPKVLWRFEKNLPYVPAPLLYDGIIYMVKSGGIVTAVDPVTGALLKESRVADALGEYFASPLAGDGKVYLASEEGKVTILEAGRDLRPVKVNDFGEEIHATPAIARNAIFVRVRSRLYCFRSAPPPRRSTPP